MIFRWYYIYLTPVYLSPEIIRLSSDEPHLDILYHTLSKSYMTRTDKKLIMGMTINYFYYNANQIYSCSLFKIRCNWKFNSSRYFLTRYFLNTIRCCEMVVDYKTRIKVLDFIYFTLNSLFNIYLHTNFHLDNRI